MARSLAFANSGQEFSLSIHKVDRSKLYGSVSVETLDLEGSKCQIATLAIDGNTLIPNGGTALGYLNTDGDWLTRSDLTSVDLAGNELETVESSFKQTIELQETVSIESFLDHSVRLVYSLEADGELPADVLQQLKDGAIFRFEFSYRGGVDTDPAFVMQTTDEQLWLLISDENNIEFVGLEQAAICVANSQTDENEAEDESDDGIDFGML